MPNLLTQRRILRPWRPDQIHGLALWFDAADFSTIKLDGSSNVSKWNDKSVNGRHVEQPTAANRPIYVPGGDANSINGLPVLSSDSATVRRLVIANTNILSDKTGATLFAVFRQVAGSSTATGPFNCHYLASNTTRRFTTQVTSGNIATRKASGDADSTVSVTITNGITTLLTSRLDLSVATFQANVNGVTTTGTSPAAGAFSSDGDSIQVLCQANQIWRAYTGEILFYDRALSDSESSAITHYLQSKWGTP